VPEYPLRPVHALRAKAWCKSLSRLKFRSKTTRFRRQAIFICPAAIPGVDPENSEIMCSSVWSNLHATWWR